MKTNRSLWMLPAVVGALALSQPPHLFAASRHQKADARSQAAQDIPVGSGANDLKLSVVAEGPATRQAALQIACFFEHDPKGDVYNGGTGVFVQKTKGLIKNLRDRGDFQGHELETILLTPPSGTVPAQKLLLIGLGDPKTFNAQRMKRVGVVALRETLRLGVDKVSFSPNITDAGVKTVRVGVYGEQMIEGVLLAYDTEKRLQKENVAPARTLTEFTLEAGHDNIPAAQEAIKTAIEKANAQIAARSTNPYLVQK